MDNDRSNPLARVARPVGEILRAILGGVVFEITFWLGIVMFFLIVFVVLWMMLGWKMFEPRNLDMIITGIISVLVVFIAGIAIAVLIWLWRKIGK